MSRLKKKDESKRDAKNDAKNDAKTMIYQLNGINGTNNAKLICLGYVSKNEDFKDIELKVNGDEKVLEIFKDVFLKMYKCNISDGFLMANKKIPLYCASVIYQR